MDNLDDSENTAKISDSAYSNSCSNSQSRRSHSSKSTHSGSNSSGSSGYGGKPSTSGSCNQPTEKRIKDKDSKKKKHTQTVILESQVVTECQPPDPLPIFETPKEVNQDAEQTATSANMLIEDGPESMDIVLPELVSAKEEILTTSLQPVPTPSDFVVNYPTTAACCSGSHKDGFSCVISMHDGVVMYTTSSLTTTLGFPKDMWIGRSFIDFIHTRDRSTFASQITNGLVVPKTVNGTQEKAQTTGNSFSTMVCRIRQYRGLQSGFGVKERVVTFLPFLLKLTFKNVSDEDGEIIYLVIQATPFFSAFKMSNEIVTKPVPFVMRHAANGNLEYLDPDSVPYLGYLPQDVIGKDALQLYHPDDMCYLTKIYETIVKEGGLPRCKPYRLMTQNGDYVKLETEWSSFINPWSRKLEFVIGKHYIVEGPTNPDVFQTPEPEKTPKGKDEEQTRYNALRENIILILNEVLTKPAEVAKQQMSKRCQDLASFMESLMEEQPKNDEELRFEINEADHSYYERDSMLGGISPHHEYNDSKSSSGTPLSYNQLNYNENLQRYFNCHQPFTYEDYNTVTGKTVLELKDAKQQHSTSNCMSPVASYAVDSGDLSSSGESGIAVRGSSPVGHLCEFPQVRLTESILNKHNSEMEKELMRMHRETRSCSKGEREKTSCENRQKKKEHLARCNASFQPTAVASTSMPEPSTYKKPHGLKRVSRQAEAEPGTHKHHCPSPRQHRRKQSTSTAPVQSSATITTTVAATHWHPNPMNNMNAFILGVGIPQQMSIMSPVPMPQPVTAVPTVTGMTGLFPMYYAPAPSTALSSSNTTQANNDQPQPATSRSQQCQPPGMQCMMYGPPIMYSPFGTQVSYPMQQTMMAQTMQYANSLNPLGLTSSNYEEACKPSLPIRPNKSSSIWREKKRIESQAASCKTDRGSGDSISSTSALHRESADNSSGSRGGRLGNTLGACSSLNCFGSKSTEAVPGTELSRDAKKTHRMRGSDDTMDRTDGESSYSSFYSSFFRTESGSAEDSGDVKKVLPNKIKKGPMDNPGQIPMDTTSTYFEPREKKVTRRKMEPPWMEQVCVTSELIYKYQIYSKTVEEVLLADKQKMSNFSQPSLVNEQLGQLYLDLQLEGVATRLTLEEGITSSSSSGEETSTNTSKARRKREYSKLVMIYEEDAPLPPPSVEDEAEPTSAPPT